MQFTSYRSRILLIPAICDSRRLGGRPEANPKTETEVARFPRTKLQLKLKLKLASLLVGQGKLVQNLQGVEP